MKAFWRFFCIAWAQSKIQYLFYMVEIREDTDENGNHSLKFVLLR